MDIDQRPPVTLYYKYYGEMSCLQVAEIHTAIDLAVAMINSGSGIPKAILKHDQLIYSEQDINTYWDEHRA